MSKRKIIIVIICLGVAGLHFITGPSYSGPFPNFVNGYLIDILLPFAMYLLAYLPKNKFIQKPWVRGSAVFLVGFAVETLQYFGIEIFGSTFDPIDYIMYLSGIVAGVLFEKIAFKNNPGAS